MGETTEKPQDRFAQAVSCMFALRDLKVDEPISPQALADLHNGAQDLFGLVRDEEQEFSKVRGTYARAWAVDALPGERERAWVDVVGAAHALVAAKRRADFEDHNF